MNTQTYFWIFVIAVVLITIFLRGKQTAKKKDFQYRAKDCIVTNAEAKFFWKLDRVINGKYFIFPQAHLSTILNYKVPGQNWDAARNHINRKSVDYVICDKETLKPVYAIELDDNTHNYSDRQKRDKEVERIFQCADIPLVRFNDMNISDQEIEHRFIEARQKINSEPN